MGMVRAAELTDPPGPPRRTRERPARAAAAAGPVPRTMPARILEAFADAFHARDWERLGALSSTPSRSRIDHRSLSTEPGRGREEAVALYRSMARRHRTSASPSRSWRATTASSPAAGTYRGSMGESGVSEIVGPFVSVARDGLWWLGEYFDPEDEERALARFASSATQRQETARQPARAPAPPLPRPAREGDRGAGRLADRGTTRRRLRVREPRGRRRGGGARARGGRGDTPAGAGGGPGERHQPLGDPGDARRPPRADPDDLAGRVPGRNVRDRVPRDRVLGPDDLVHREERFEPDQLDAARARLDELAGGPAADAHRFAHAFNARDWEAVDAVFAEDWSQFVHRPLRTAEYSREGRRGELATGRRAGPGRARRRGALGPRARWSAAVFRFRWAGHGDGGAFETAAVVMRDAARRPHRADRRVLGGRPP